MEKEVSGKYVSKHEFTSKITFLFIIIDLLIAIIIVLLIIFFLMFYNKPADEQFPSKDLVMIKNCVQQENLNQECENLFKNSGGYGDCKTLGELKDRCIYRFAIESETDLCREIGESNLRIKCQTDLSNKIESRNTRGLEVVEPIPLQK